MVQLKENNLTDVFAACFVYFMELEQHVIWQLKTSNFKWTVK